MVGSALGSEGDKRMSESVPCLTVDAPTVKIVANRLDLIELLNAGKLE